MASEKTPALFLSKTSFECDNQKEKICTKSTVSWIIAAVLLSLLIVLTILFYHPFEQKIREEQLVDLRRISPKFGNVILEEAYQENSKTPWDLDFLIDPADLCATRNPPNSEDHRRNPEVKLLILVTSLVDHFEQRKAIRNTWGSVAEKPLGPMRLGFVLGKSTNKAVNDLVCKESLDFKDIIQVDFEENFYQSTTKSILMFKWTASRCPHAQYFLKADDDTFVNLGAIVNILSREPYASQEKFIGGCIKNDIQPLKFQNVEISVAVEQYPTEDYPPYASGSAYFMSIPTAIQMFDASKEVRPILPQEDAFLTGLVAQLIDAPRIHEASFINENPPNPPTFDAYSTLSTAHSVTPDVLEQVWNEMAQSIEKIMFSIESAPIKKKKDF